MPLKLAVVVHGRFHAFDLVRELLRQDVEVTLLTNYPKCIVRRYDIPDARVVNSLSHGLLSRCVDRFGLNAIRPAFERLLHPWFARWASGVLANLSLDAIYSFSGVSREILMRFPHGQPLRSLVRGSAHIRTQARLLREEQLRCGCPIPQPSDWMIEREIEEYGLADFVVVISSFAAKSFLKEGFRADQLRVLPLGADLKRFQADEAVLQDRSQRMLRGDPLVILTVGSFSYQKGALDFARVARRLQSHFRFRWVGDCAQETVQLRRQLRGVVEFVPRQEQFDLPNQYRKADIFLFPTIQDGFGVVLAQASAAGLPSVATCNSGGPDCIVDGVNGWVVPIRDPEAVTERLLWCDGHREHLARMVREASSMAPRKDWAQVATQLTRMYSERLHSAIGLHAPQS